MVYREHALTHMLVPFLIAVFKYLQRSIWRMGGIILTPGLWVQCTEAVKTWWSTWQWEWVSKQTRKQREEHPSALLLSPSFSFLFSPWDSIPHILGKSSLTNILRSVSPKWSKSSQIDNDYYSSQHLNRQIQLSTKHHVETFSHKSVKVKIAISDFSYEMTL